MFYKKGDVINCCSYWWLRSPNVGNSYNVYNVNSSGTQNNNNANNTNGVSLDCNNQLQNQNQSKLVITEIFHHYKEQYSLPKLKSKNQVNLHRRCRCQINSDISTINSDIFSYKSLLESAKSCLKGVCWKNSVIRWKLHLLKYTYQLYNSIKLNKYKLDQAVQFYIFRPKKRIVNSLKFKDRVVHRQLVRNGLYQLLLKDRIYDNCACQIGKGTSFAISRTKVHLKKYFQKYGNTGWVLKLDIKKFFENISHSKLKQMVHKKVQNQKIQNIIYQIIDSSPGQKGIGLGSQINQLLAVSYLSPLDHLIKQKLQIKHYVRYADDLLLIHRSKLHLQIIKKYIENWLNNYNLQLNPKSCLYPLQQGITFLNIKFKIKSTGKIITSISKQNYYNAKRKYKKLKYLVLNKIINPTDFFNSFSSWASYALQTNVHSKIYKFKQELFS